MADNVALPGTGMMVATDEISGVHWQYMKLAFGATDTSIPVDVTAPLPVVLSASNATITPVAASATSVTLIGARAARRGAVIVNDGTANLFIAYAATASSTAFTYKLAAGVTWEMPVVYTGLISGIWDTANGSARITEIY